MRKNEPNFFVIGVVKGGTTSLYNYLNVHPDIFLTPIKETNHFSDSDMDFKNFEAQYKIDSGLNIDKYLNGKREVVHIAHVRERSDYLKLYQEVKEEKARGEVCNSYFFCPKTAENIQSSFPEAKLIVMLRNPIKRVYSQYLMNIREAKNLNKTFIEEIEADYHKTNKGWGVSHNYLELGLYSNQLKNYLKHFSSDQLLVLFFEDFMLKKQAGLNEIFNFIGVEKFEFENFEKFNSAQMPRSKFLNKVLSSSGLIEAGKSIISREKRQKIKSLLYTDKGVPEISKEEKQYLIDFYRKDILELGKILKKDLGHWLA